MKDITGLSARKTRKCGTLSEFKSPPNAPSWAIRLEGIFINSTMILIVCHSSGVGDENRPFQETWPHC